MTLFSGFGTSAFADDPVAYTGQTDVGSYTISTAAQLAELAKQVNLGQTYAGSTFTLTADIDLDETNGSWTGGAEWTPIAVYTVLEGSPAAIVETNNSFAGTFDGAGHYIKNITINKLTGGAFEGYSLFGKVGVGGTVKNLGVTGEVGSYRCAAGIAGYNYGTISHCFSQVSVAANGGGGLRGSGGIVGHNEGLVEYCINAGSVHNDYRRAGGIAGYNYGSTASIDHCFSVGAVSSASEGYSGAIAATNGENAETAGSITDCYYLQGSSAAAVGFDNKAAGSDTLAFNANAMILDGSGDPSTSSLKSVLNDPVADAFIDAAAGSYPVLSWQTGYTWDTFTISIAAATGGTFTAKVNGNEITGAANKLVAGTEIVLEASIPNAGYLFTGFTAKSGEDTSNLGGLSKSVPYTINYTVSGNVELGASYISTATQALTVSEQTGLHGKPTVHASKTWQELLDASTAHPAGYGYMYAKGTAGWNMVAATKYVTVSTLLSGLTLDNADSIIVSAGDGIPKVIPTWGQLNGDLYFFPNAVNSTAGGNVEGKTTVPAAIAIDWASGAVNTANADIDTAGEALTAIAAKAYNSTSLRFVYGSLESDYTNASGPTVTGNRLWSGVTNISLAKTPAKYSGGSIIEAPLADTANNNREPYYTYGAVYDSENQEVSISASGLVPFTKDADGLDDWVGIGIPVPEGTVYTDIWTGSNESVFANAGKTDKDFTAGETDYIAVYWDYKAADPVEYIQFSFDGGATVYEIAVDTSGITANAVEFCGVGLSLEMMQTYPSTAVYSCSKKGSIYTYTVTGITISDILKHYASDIKPAALKFGASTTVYDCPYIGTESEETPEYKGYGWSQSMLIWSQKDNTGAEQISSGIKSAVNGGTGNMWQNDLVKVTKEADAALVIKSEDGIFADRYVSLAQLKEHPTVGTDWTKVTKKGTTPYETITGAAINDILTTFTPYGNHASILYFSTDKLNDDSSPFMSTTYSGVTDGLDTDFNQGMVTWSENVTDDALENKLYSALNGGSGMYWFSGISSMNVTLKNLVTFSVTPANAGVEVKNASGAAVSAVAPNAYVLPDGGYTYTVSASGYENATGSFTVAADNQTITKALTVTPGGGGGVEATYNITGYSGANGTVTSSAASAMAGQTITLTVTPNSGYVLTGLTLSNGTLKESLSSTATKYTFTMPSANVTVTAVFEEVELTVYVQKGAKGTPTVGALFSRSQLEDLATTNASPTTGYIYYKNDNWDAVVATKYVTLDSLLSDAGISFGSGDSIAATASDDFNDTVSYKNMQQYKYYFDPNNNGAQSVAPYIIALEHRSGTLSGSSLSSIASGSKVTNLRSCYGCSEEQYTKKEAFGRRLVSSATSLTIIQSAVVDKNTKDGVSPETVKETKFDVKVNVTNNMASASVSSDEFTKMLDNITSEGGKSILEINAVSGKETTKSEVSLAANVMNQLSTNVNADGLKITTDQGSIQMDQATLQGIASQGKNAAVTILVEKPEKTALTAEQQALVGNKPVYSFSITAGDQKITNFSGSVAVSLPYKLSDGEDPSNVTIYHLSSDGKVEKFKAVYNKDTGTVSFATGHFSVFLASNEATAAYDDVLITNWFYDSANYAVKNGLMVGTSATKFSPDQNTTRAMLVTVLWRLSGEPETTLKESPFTDVKDKNSWYYNAVLWAYEKDIAKGLSESIFAPSKTLSRQELVTMLHRYSGINNVKITTGDKADTGHFTDWSGISVWAVEGFEWAYSSGIVTGMTDNTISPDTNATRAQIASILMRYKNL